ncbi:MAG: PqqD family protein [Ruminococcaceae bacterium]|nr:PqqD family protein [Oscillospiraceae bacterium]
MRIKPGFTLKNDKGKYIVTATGETARSFSSSIVLQDHAVFMWNLLENNEMSKEALVRALLDEFPISTVLALNDVDAFFKTLKENGILE